MVGVRGGDAGCGSRAIVGSVETVAMLAVRRLVTMVQPATCCVHVSLMGTVVFGESVTKMAAVLLFKMPCGVDANVDAVADLCDGAERHVEERVSSLGDIFHLAADGSLALTSSGAVAVRALQDAFVHALATAHPAEEHEQGVVTVVVVERVVDLHVDNA